MGCNLNRHSPFFWWCQLDKEEFWIFHSRHVNRMVTILGQHNCFQCGWLLSTTNNVNKKGVITRLIRVITGIIIQLSYTVRIPIFWLIGLYHVKLGCDETTSLTSLSWCTSRGVDSTLHITFPNNLKLVKNSPVCVVFTLETLEH